MTCRGAPALTVPTLATREGDAPAAPVRRAAVAVKPTAAVAVRPMDMLTAMKPTRIRFDDNGPPAMNVRHILGGAPTAGPIVGSDVGTRTMAAHDGRDKGS